MRTLGVEQTEGFGSWVSRAKLCVIGTLALAVSLARAVEEPYDLWYVIEIDGQRAGWYHEKVEIDGDLVTTVSDTSMSIRRGPSTVTIGIESSFVETDRHEPKRWETSISMGSTPVVRVYTFGEDGVEVTTTEGGQASTRVTNAPEGNWLTPGGIREFARSRLASGADEITYGGLDPMQQLTPVQSTVRGFSDASVDVLGRTVQAIRGELISSATPGVKSIVFMDDAGRLLRTEVSIAGMHVVTLAADKELALGELDPPELMARTFVRTARPIARARRTSDATYLLRVDDGELIDLPETSAQTVERIDAKTIRVRVRKPGRFEAGLAPTSEEGTLDASSMLNWKDEKIQELASKAGGGAQMPDLRRAELMRKSVHRHINAKDLGVGFGSASEVVRSRQGDCSEHATLLAAMLRAEGIPSRVASGLVYADGFLGERNIFGYHMWTQALVEVEGQKRWVDLDATLGASNAFDATHIALVLSTMADDEGSNALVRLAPLLGRLEVEIESVE